MEKFTSKKFLQWKITDITDVIAPNAKRENVGIAQEKKLHEQMIGLEDAINTMNILNFIKFFTDKRLGQRYK